MSEETTDLTVEDIVGEAAGASYHTILELWQRILLPLRTERTRRISPQWSNRIVSAYAGMGFAEMAEFRDRYFDKLEQMLQILEASIEEDDEALKQTTAEEDVEHNTARYVQILVDWQKALLLWELEWTSDDPHAAPELAAISEVHKMLFAQEGLTALLDRINLQFTEEDRDRLSMELEDLKNLVGEQ